MDLASHGHDEAQNDEDLRSRLLPRESDHPYIAKMHPTARNLEEGLPAEPDEGKGAEEDTVDVLGDGDEFAVVPKHGITAHLGDSEGKQAGASRSEQNVELVDMHKILSSAGPLEESTEVTKAVPVPKKRGLQGMSHKGKHVLGLVLVCLHCLTVVASAQTAKSTYKPDFSAPFFIVYFRSSWRITIFPVFMVLKYVQRSLRNKTKEPTSFTKTFLQCESVFGPHGLTAKSFVWPTGLLAMLWIVVQFAHVFAVKFLNNSIVQALFCSETAFCYMLSALILKVPVYFIKVGAVMVALGGVGFMVYSQGRDDFSWEGIAICLIGAVLGSLYMVAFKKLIGKSEDVGKALLVTSTMALFITIVGWPFVIILNITGIEYWDWATFPWGTICISSTLTLFSISFFNLCLTLTSPLIMTLSKLLGIPVNYVIDWTFWSHVFDEYQIIGCLLIAVGFVAIALPESWIAIKHLRKLCGRHSVELSHEVIEDKPVQNGKVH